MKLLRHYIFDRITTPADLFYILDVFNVFIAQQKQYLSRPSAQRGREERFLDDILSTSVNVPHKNTIDLVSFLTDAPNFKPNPKSPPLQLDDVSTSPLRAYSRSLILFYRVEGTNAVNSRCSPAAANPFKRHISHFTCCQD